MPDKVEVEEQLKLQWPDGWVRTRIQDRKRQSAWKKSMADYRNGVVRELERMGASSVLITRSGNERMDPGVAVWWSMRKPDFTWQEGLQLDTPAPTLDQIDAQFRALATKVHPDRSDGGDIEVFKQLNEHRKNARAWVMGTHDNRREYVLACDRFEETRWNLAALRLAFAAFRQLERVGVPAILERTLDKAFKQALPMSATGGV
jgi:hypothetical protein